MNSVNSYRGNLVINGESVPYQAGDTVLVALVRARKCDQVQLAAYCTLGACYGCLVRMADMRVTRACLLVASDGLVLESANV